MIGRVTTQPSNQVRSVADAVATYPYVWLASREAPDPHPRTVLLLSDGPVPQVGEAGSMVEFVKYDGTSFRDWRILAAFAQGELISGHADPDARYPFHKVESR